MRAVSFFFLAGIGLLAGCQKDELAPHEDIAVLYEQFHGKYKAVSSVSDAAVDLNWDGRASTNLLNEISDLGRNTDLEIRILEQNRGYGEAGHLFDEFWQQQVVTRNWNHNSPDSLQIHGFVSQITGAHFTVNKELSELLIKPRVPGANVIDEGRFAAPQSVTVAGEEQLRVVTRRLFFTRKGWQFFRVTTLYKRYTKVT